MTADRAAPGERGRAMGTLYTAWELGISGGSMLLGLCATTLGYAATWGTAAAIAGRARSPRSGRPGDRAADGCGAEPGRAGPAASAGRAALAARGAQDARRGADSGAALVDTS